MRDIKRLYILTLVNSISIALVGIAGIIHMLT